MGEMCVNSSPFYLLHEESGSGCIALQLAGGVFSVDPTGRSGFGSGAQRTGAGAAGTRRLIQRRSIWLADPPLNTAWVAAVGGHPLPSGVMLARTKNALPATVSRRSPIRLDDMKFRHVDGIWHHRARVDMAPSLIFAIEFKRSFAVGNPSAFRQQSRCKLMMISDYF